MKVLLDENVSAGLAHTLDKMGYSVLTAGSDLPTGLDDDSVFQFALKEDAILVTRDHHFTNPFRFDAEKTLGIIYIHHGNLTSAQEIVIVEDFLRKHPPAEFRGKLVTLYSNAVRIR
jgi:predicted nuclease of predicted toxin-antitoxin system